MSLLAFMGAAITEIAGCFSFWAWIRLNQSILWLIPGTCSLWIFAYLLTQVDAAYAGRAYAAYGAVYITASILWMWAIEKNTPDRFDLLGMLICCLGAGIILFGSRA
jgi:small multidrug resistance family-3 protein